MNTDITASAKPEYPVIDRNPPFTKTVANFNTLDYLRLTTISGISVTVGYLSGPTPSSSSITLVYPRFDSWITLYFFQFCRNKARDQGAVDGHRRFNRSYGWVHVRVPELRRTSDGILPQRWWGRSLQEVICSLFLPNFQSRVFFCLMKRTSNGSICCIFMILYKGTCVNRSIIKLFLLPFLYYLVLTCNIGTIDVWPINLFLVESSR